MTNIVHICEHKKSNPFGTTIRVLALRACRRVIGVVGRERGERGGWVLNGMRISLISSPNSKEEFFYFHFIMFEIFIFFALCDEKLVGGRSILQVVQEYN
jgi:hypothetical protein